MTRRPRKAKATRKASRKHSKATRAAKPKSLDGFISSAARALDLKIDDAWMPAVKTAISFFERNMPDLWTPLPMREGSALRIFAHSGKREKREWDYFVPFEMHTS